MPSNQKVVKIKITVTFGLSLGGSFPQNFQRREIAGALSWEKE